MTTRTFDPSRCEYCGGERWTSTFNEPCRECNPDRRLRPWEDWPEPETPTWDSLADALRYGGSTGAPMLVRSERLGCVLTVRDRRGLAPRPKADPWPDFPAIGPITTAVRGLDPEAWR